MKTKVEETFSAFFEKWICQLEDYLLLLLNVSTTETSRDSDYEALVGKLTAHHKSYYTVKWAEAQKDVLAFFSPVWLTPLETASLWVTGWKPSMAFRLFDSLIRTGVFGVSLTGVSEEQVKKIEELRAETRMDEGKVESELERQQMALADRRIEELARLVVRLKKTDSVVSQVDKFVEMVVKSLKGGSERVMKMADCVRLKTLKGILDVLKPRQRVVFLAVTAMVLVQLRKRGKEKENVRHVSLMNDCATQ